MENEDTQKPVKLAEHERVTINCMTILKCKHYTYYARIDRLVCDLLTSLLRYSSFKRRKLSSADVINLMLHILHRYQAISLKKLEEQRCEADKYEQSFLCGGVAAAKQLKQLRQQTQMFEAKYYSSIADYCFEFLSSELIFRGMRDREKPMHQTQEKVDSPQRAEPRIVADA